MGKVDCDWCGETIKKKPSLIERSEHHFCDPDCHSKWQSENATGENNNAYAGGKTEVTCEWCGDTITRWKSQLKDRDMHFCDRDCKNEWQSKNLNGKNSPFWRGGWEQSKYIHYWDTEARPSALERDGYECVNCGMTEEQHYEMADMSLPVHHIKPVSEFENEKTAHQLDNLVTLCIACHKNVHWGNINIDEIQ